MFSDNNKISIRQLQCLLILDLFGSAIITLPRTTAKVVGSDNWISVMLGGLFMVWLMGIFVSIGLLNKEKTFVEISDEYFTRPLGIFLSLGLIAKIILGCGLELRVFCEILAETMLFRTPVAVATFALLLTGVYIAKKGYECRGRVSEILFVFVFCPLVIVMIAVMFSADFSNLQPVFSHTGGQYFHGGVITFFSISGLEFLYFVFPYLKIEKDTKKHIRNAGLFITGFMTLITLLTLAKFGEISVQSKLFPVLQMMNTVEFPGSFLERQDIFMMWFFTASAFASLSASVFFSVLGLNRIFKSKRIKESNWLFLVAPLIFIIAIFPDNIAQTYKLLEHVKFYGGIVYLLILPILLYLLSKGKRGAKE